MPEYFRTPIAGGKPVIGSGSAGSVPFTPGGSYGGGNLGIIVPPNGFAGHAQQTPAVQALFGRMGGRKSAAGRRRRRKSNGKAKRRSAPLGSSRRTRALSRKPAGRRRARLVKGSAAAKRHMARIRRKRR
jgi:hypothetical protein